MNILLFNSKSRNEKFSSAGACSLGMGDSKAGWFRQALKLAPESVIIFSCRLEDGGKRRGTLGDTFGTK